MFMPGNSTLDVSIHVDFLIPGHCFNIGLLLFTCLVMLPLFMYLEKNEGRKDQLREAEKRIRRMNRVIDSMERQLEEKDREIESIGDAMVAIYKLFAPEDVDQESDELQSQSSDSSDSSVLNQDHNTKTPDSSDPLDEAHNNNTPDNSDAISDDSTVPTELIGRIYGDVSGESSCSERSSSPVYMDPGFRNSGTRPSQKDNGNGDNSESHEASQHQLQNHSLSGHTSNGSSTQMWLDSVQNCEVIEEIPESEVHPDSESGEEEYFDGVRVDSAVLEPDEGDEADDEEDEDEEGQEEKWNGKLELKWRDDKGELDWELKWPWKWEGKRGESEEVSRKSEEGEDGADGNKEAGKGEMPSQRADIDDLQRRLSKLMLRSMQLLDDVIQMRVEREEWMSRERRDAGLD